MKALIRISFFSYFSVGFVQYVDGVSRPSAQGESNNVAHIHRNGSSGWRYFDACGDPAIGKLFEHQRTDAVQVESHTTGGWQNWRRRRVRQSFYLFLLSFINPLSSSCFSSPLGFSELFNEFRLQENLHSLDDILNAIIDSEGMSFNDLKPIYKEFLLKLAVTLTKDELYQRSKSIMRRQKKRQLRRKKSSAGGYSVRPQK